MMTYKENYFANLQQVHPTNIAPVLIAKWPFRIDARVWIQTLFTNVYYYQKMGYITDQEASILILQKEEAEKKYGQYWGDEIEKALEEFEVEDEQEGV